MGQISYTISLVMIGLFTVAILGFAINFASDNGSAVSISDDPELSTLNSQSSGNLSGFKTASENTYISIIGSSVETSTDTTQTGGQFALTPLSALGAIKNILKVGWIKIFGSEGSFAIFLTALIGMMGFIFALYIWKTWVGRNPD